MGAWAARKAARIVTNSQRVLAMELLAAAQGLDLLRPLKSTAAIEKIYQRVRRDVACMEDDHFLHPDIVRVEDLIRTRELESYVAI
jgi:histidine ammonia-lyase